MREDLAQGRLVALRPDQPQEVALHWQVNRLVAGAVTGLTAAVRRAASTALVPV